MQPSAGEARPAMAGPTRDKQCSRLLLGVLVPVKKPGNFLFQLKAVFIIAQRRRVLEERALDVVWEMVPLQNNCGSQTHHYAFLIYPVLCSRAVITILRAALVFPATERPDEVIQCPWSLV